MRARRPRLTYSNVVATLALFIALGGVSWAAVKLPANSVGEKQLKKNAVTAKKIKKNAITGEKVKDGSLSDADVRIDAARLGKVPSAAFADSAGSSADAMTVVVKRSLVGGSGDDYTTAANNAPEIPLISAGQVTIYGKCFKNNALDAVLAWVYAKSSGNGSYLASANINLPGNRLNVGSPVTIVDASSFNDNFYSNNDDGSTLLIGNDGVGVSASIVASMVNSYSGPVSDVYPGSESCMFRLHGRAVKL